MIVEEIKKLIERERQQKYHHRKISSGIVADTFCLKPDNGGLEIILQIWSDNLTYQACKKLNIFTLLEQVGVSVPKALKFGRFKDYSYLLTEKLPGYSLNDIESTVHYYQALASLGTVLRSLHSLEFESHFGWFFEDIKEAQHRTLAHYLSSEVVRFASVLSQCAGLQLWQKLEKYLVQSIDKISRIKTYPCLCWYDIQPSNVLVSLTLAGKVATSLIDPGAARIGVAEWDLAHSKIHLCTNTLEFDCLTSSYGMDKLNFELIDLLVPIVLVDDLTLGFERNIDFIKEETLQRIKAIGWL
jgi:fructosamine-3-kinase